MAALPPIGGAATNHCYMCLESDHDVICGGCACRGSAGFGHLCCFISSATHGHWTRWRDCATCKQQFTGSVQLGLAKARWALDVDKPRENDDKLWAQDLLAKALRDASQYDASMALYEECVAIKRIKLGDEHRETLASLNNLAGCYSKTGRLGQTKAEVLFREVLEVKRRRFGDTHPDTLILIGNLGAPLPTTRVVIGPWLCTEPVVS